MIKQVKIPKLSKKLLGLLRLAINTNGWTADALYSVEESMTQKQYEVSACFLTWALKPGFVQRPTADLWNDFQAEVKTYGHYVNEGK